MALTRNVELEGPLQYSDLKDLAGEVYNVWFDCDCGRRMIIRASTSGQYSMSPTKNIWKLVIDGEKLSTTPSILFHHPMTGDGRPAGECHLTLTNEPFTKTSMPKMNND